MPRVNEWMRKHGPRGEVRLLVGSRVFTWPGKVTRLKGSLDQTTRTIPIVVEVKDPFKDVKPGEHPPLLPGMFVEVTLRGKRLENVVKVPRIAVHDGAVYVAEDGKLAIRDVTVELMTREDAIISQGLKNGDLVILSYISVPAPGTRLRVIKETAADEEAH
jgi:multidrug efflux pump subunit AcrA (membrane-fusion protein)